MGHTDGRSLSSHGPVFLVHAKDELRGDRAVIQWEPAPCRAERRMVNCLPEGPLCSESLCLDEL